MAVLGTNFNYVYDGILTVDTIVKPTLTTPELQVFFPNFMPNVQSQWQLPKVEFLRGITRARTGCGNVEPTGKKINITNRTLTVADLQIYFEQCPDQFEGTVYETLMKTGNDVNDLTGTQLEKLIQQLLSDAGRRDIFNLATLGDTTLANAEINAMDGFWKIIQDEVANYCVTRVANLGSGTLAANVGLEILQELYEKAPRLLKAMPVADKQVAVTDAIFDNLLASYESRTSGSDAQFGVLQTGPDMGNGVPSLLYRGIKVFAVYEWSETIEEYALGNPHRAAYFAPKNWWIGTERRGDVTNISTEVWYDRNEDLNKFRTRFKAGVQFAHCMLIAVSY